MRKTAVLVTTYNRSRQLARLLNQVLRFDVPVLVVDDGSRKDHASHAAALCEAHNIAYCLLPKNRGLACAMNIGLNYYLADGRVEAITYLQDDTDCDPLLLKAMDAVMDPRHRPLCSGRHGKEHLVVGQDVIQGVNVLYKDSSSAVHLHAHRDYWASVMPIPTKRLGAPCRIPGQKGRGVGSDVDWWIATRAPMCVAKTGRKVVVVPGLVRTIHHKAQDSSWGNEHKAGKDGPLSRSAILNWMRGR